MDYGVEHVPRTRGRGHVKFVNPHVASCDREDRYFMRMPHAIVLTMPVQVSQAVCSPDTLQHVFDFGGYLSDFGPPLMKYRSSVDASRV